MSRLIFACLLLSQFYVMVLPSTTSTTTPLTPGAECAYWQKKIQDLNQGTDDSTLKVRCRYHPEKCEQLDCQGSVRSFIWNFKACWGMIVNHCDDPISVDVYLQSESYGVNQSNRIFHNTEVPVPQLSQTLGGYFHHVVLFFELRKNVNNTITFKAAAKTYYKISPEADPYYPPSMQLDIVPETVYPVSSCKKVTKTRNIVLGKCGADEGSSQNMSTTPRPPPTKVVIHSKTYNKSCDLEDLKSYCHPTEMCRAKQEGGRDGVCTCFPHQSLCVSTGYCSVNSGCTTVHVIPVPDSQKGGSPQSTSSGPINRTALIIGSVCGGVVLLVIVAVLIVFFVKRRGDRYRGRQLLLTEDDTDGII